MERVGRVAGWARGARSALGAMWCLDPMLADERLGGVPEVVDVPRPRNFSGWRPCWSRIGASAIHVWCGVW
eukprot:12468567-Prorocentrum_lima.AAC.1